MSYVKTEGKWLWYLKCEYGVRTIAAYLQLGTSLGMVQARHACRHVWLGLHRLLRSCSFTHRRHRGGETGEQPHDDDTRLYLKALRAMAVSVSKAGQPRDGTQHVSVDGREAHGGGGPNSLPTDNISTVDLLVELIREFDTLLLLTHGEAVSVRLPGLLRRQEKALHEQRVRRAMLGMHELPAHLQAQEDALFVLSESDPTYQHRVASGLPVLMTYTEAVVLFDLLSDAVAWELFVLGRASGGAARAQNTIEATCIALMMPNSVEYNMLWLSCSAAGAIHTFLDELYGPTDSPSVSTHATTTDSQDSVTYRPCPVALLNTNIANNAMLFHALECVGSVMVVLDAAYAHLLFVTKGSGAVDLHIPPCVRRIFLWRWGGQDETALFTPEMRTRLDAFNAQSRLSSRFASECSAGLAHSTSAPPLDLLNVVQAEYAAYSRETPATTRRGRAEVVPSHLLLLARILAQPPAWLSAGQLPDAPTPPPSVRPTAGSVESTTAVPVDESGLVLGGVRAECDVAERGNVWSEASAAPFLARILPQRPSARHRARAFDAWKVRFYRRLQSALNRFTPVQPLLFIYTSGTTGGMPKAARFSHLRFFATVHLSRLMHFRSHIADAVRGHMSESSRCARSKSLWRLTRAAMHLVADMLQGIMRRFGLCRPRRYSQSELALQQELNCITMYNCLPMYHAVGCAFCMGHMMHALEEQDKAQRALRSRIRCLSADGEQLASVRVATARMVLRSRFSASHFVSDLQRYHVTVLQYIGETLRYATLCERHRASQAADREARGGEAPTCWRVPYAFGNGLRKDIWEECMRRLSIVQPLEFYSSTEGNIFLFNLFGIPGVIGHMARFPGLLNYLISMHYFPMFPFQVLRFDETTQDIWRDPRSHYGKRAAVGEVGELVGEIVEGFDIFALRRFDGYHNSKLAEDEGRKKIVRHVLWPWARTAFFRSGDLVTFDDFGFCTFVDRVGETFRWKGENVSTVEVSNTLQGVQSGAVEVQEAVVYGVAVPGCEGKAGMALLRLRRRGSTAGLTPREERLFLQNELYPRLAGTVADDDGGAVRANGTAGERRTRVPHALLPAYAIPLFIRVESDAEPMLADVSDDHQAVVATSTDSAADSSRMTTTFKYRKYLLSRDGYMIHTADSSANVEWGADSSEGCASGATVVTGQAVGDAVLPKTRIYVLVKRPAMWHSLTIGPAPSADCGGCYVPLTRTTLERVGSTLGGCGW